jgi:hypothetical protein
VIPPKLGSQLGFGEPLLTYFIQLLKGGWHGDTTQLTTGGAGLHSTLTTSHSARNRRLRLGGWG